MSVNHKQQGKMGLRLMDMNYEWTTGRKYQKMKDLQAGEGPL